MREFLWSHWRARTSAKLLATYISKEGKETDASFEIKLIPPSTLILQITDTRYRYGYNGQVFKHSQAEDDIYTVERVSPSQPCPSDVTARITVLPSSAALSGDDYCLRLIGWGNEVKSFL
jgi:hypothetical protein